MLLAPWSTSAESAAGFTRSCFVDSQNAAIVFLAVQSVDGSLCFCVISHLDKAEALAALGFTIHDDPCARHFAEGGEKRIEFVIFDREAHQSRSVRTRSRLPP